MRYANKKIAVLLTCHNRRLKTIDCLKYLFISSLHDDSTIDVYLVDDGSTDGTAEDVKNQFPGVNIIQGDGNLFWNRGMRLAWDYAVKYDYDFYLWLNDDTLLKENALSILLKNSATQKHHSIICGTCESKISGEITYGGYKKDTHKIIIPNGHLQDCYFFNGNVVLIPRYVYEAIGSLDPIFHHGLGDYDYGLRAWKNKIKSLVSSEIIGYCEKNDLARWCNPNYAFMKRFEIFYSPLGVTPFQHFIYSKRHFGIKKAITSLFSQHLRLIYPSYWLKNK